MYLAAAFRKGWGRGSAGSITLPMWLSVNRRESPRQMDTREEGETYSESQGSGQGRQWDKAL